MSPESPLAAQDVQLVDVERDALPRHRDDQAESDHDLRGRDGHDRDGEDLPVAASEVCVGLGLVVALNRRRLELDVDRLSELRG